MVKYDKELLEKTLDQYEAKLIDEDEYDKLNRDTIISFTCKCGLNHNKNFRTIFLFGGYCKDCMGKISKAKYDESVMEKYGVKNISQNKNIKEKKKATLFMNFGEDGPMRNDEIKEKMKISNLKKYGVEHHTQCEEVKEKQKATMLKNYGVEHCLQNKEIKKKAEQTLIKNFGVTNPLKNKEIHDRVTETNLSKYGCENVFQNEKIKEKIRETNLIKYGYESHMQNPEMAEKNSHASYLTKQYFFPSGKKIKIQGYEKFALDELIKENIDEDDIITERKKVPEIWYYDDENKKHRHYVDIFIPSLNKCIEVKSTWTAEKKKDNIFLKQEEGKKMGYNYEIWVYDGNGKKVSCYT